LLEDSSIPFVVSAGADILKILNRKNERKRKIQKTLHTGFGDFVNMKTMDEAMIKQANEDSFVAEETVDEETGNVVLKVIGKAKEKAGDSYSMAIEKISKLTSDEWDEAAASTVNKVTETIKNAWGAATKYFDEKIDQVMAIGLGDLQYIGIRIERGTSVSESVSNSTGASSVSSEMKSRAQAGRGLRFNLANGNTGIGVVDSIAQFVTGTLTAAADTISLGGLSQALIQGSGYLDFPDVWQDSSVSKSHSFNVQLTSKYGDPVSIYQNIYIPLALLMAAGFPLGIGRNSYTSPFLLQAYSKGMFSVPMGIVDSMSITRGDSENGWTHDHLPTVIDVSISIRDLSPMMFLSMTDKNLLEVFRANTVMQDYMATLAGVSLADRTHGRTFVNRKFKTAMKLFAATTFNPNYWTHKIGSSGFVRRINAFAPRGRFNVSNN
jgi:hypothetical protein